MIQNASGTTSKLKMTRVQKAQRATRHLEVVHGYLQTPHDEGTFLQKLSKKPSGSAYPRALAGALTRTKDG